ITLNPASLVSDTVGAAYSQTVSAQPSGSYSITSGALPNGLLLNASTGLLSGTPTAPGTSSFTITASAGGAGGCTGSRAYSISIACLAELALNPTTLLAGQAGLAYAQQLSVTPAGSYNFALA